MFKHLPLPVQPKEVPMPEELILLFSTVTPSVIKRTYVGLFSRVGLDQSVQSSNLSNLEDWNLVSKTIVGKSCYCPSTRERKCMRNTLMKALAHNFIWSPKIDADLGGKVKQCYQCQLSRSSSPVVPMHPWDWPEHPWQ